MKRLSILLLSFAVIGAICVGTTDAFEREIGYQDEISAEFNQVDLDHGWVGFGSQDLLKMKFKDYLTLTSMQLPSSLQIIPQAYNVVVAYLLTVDNYPRGPPDMPLKVSINNQEFRSGFT